MRQDRGAPSHGSTQQTAAGPKALQVCTEAIELNNGDWESYVNRAEAHILAESYDDGACLPHPRRDGPTDHGPHRV